MSRVGIKPVEIPSGVEVKIDNTTITVKGPKGELQRELHHAMIVKQEDNTITVERPSDHKEHRSLHGTTRSIINNMIEGVTKGFEKKLQLVGVGYRAQKTGNKLILNVGLSHPVEFVEENGLEIDVPTNTQITVKGINKESVGALASNIRSTRKPEPYKGKGVRYEGEYVRRKEGKTGK
ncbi:50S ribosomal protein L6 [Salipaludibacillus sp. HK11]|uniref:50S ribosomal protein L6 n=1 Tax=Salipaludibacillus sp. HK11 TaxID=3394320 RepID=UPI0039FCC889